MAPSSPLAVAVMACALLLTGLGVWGLVREVPSFWDPCMTWGAGGDSSNGTTSLTLAPDDECPGKSATSETRVGAALRLAAVDGTALVAAVLAGIGGWRRQAVPAAVAGFLMAGEAVFLFFGLSIAFVLTLSLAILFLVAARRWRRRGPASTEPASGSDGL